uniref:Reverse transcriptase Ty1/copia-type domain-containing protein n=1 Tax=Solanum lycopersicum TaxID=4081 RepID=A0A3Q7J9E3_SOLLC
MGTQSVKLAIDGRGNLGHLTEETKKPGVGDPKMNSWRSENSFTWQIEVFLGIEVAQSKLGIVISQRKYALDILEETGMLKYRPIDTPMDPNVELLHGQGEPLK